MQEKVALILKLRDDTDIIGNNIAYYYNIGVRDFYIMLHFPSKLLLEILDSIKAKLSDSNFTFLYHDKEGYGLNSINEDYLRVLTDAAQSDGFKWIIGSDADEFLILRKHDNIYDFIKQYDHHEFVSLLFRWANYNIVDDNETLKFYEKMTIRSNYMNWTKSIGKFKNDMYFVQGLHYIADKIYGQVSEELKQIPIDQEVAYYAHFPFRFKSQFMEKQKIQSEKFGGWRASALSKDKDFFGKMWDRLIKTHLWPNNFDKELSSYETELINDPINPKLMEIK